MVVEAALGLTVIAVLRLALWAAERGETKTPPDRADDQSL